MLRAQRREGSGVLSGSAWWGWGWGQRAASMLSLSGHRWKTEVWGAESYGPMQRATRGKPVLPRSRVRLGWPVTTVATLGFLAWSKALGCEERAPCHRLRGWTLVAVWASPGDCPCSWPVEAEGCNSVSLLCHISTHTTSLSVSVRSQEARGEKPLGPQCLRPALGSGTSSPCWGKTQSCLPVIQKIASLEGLATSEWLGHQDPGVCPAPGLLGEGLSGGGQPCCMSGGHLLLSGHPAIHRAFAFIARSQRLKLKIQLIPEHGG